MSTVWQFRVLGSLDVVIDGAPVELGSVRQRRLLGALLLRRGRAASTSTLVDAVWGTDPPRSAVNTLQSHVSRLRALLGTGAVTWTSPGYLLAVEPAALDVHRFEELLDVARAAPDPTAALAALDRALSLWGGEPYPELSHYDPAVAEAARLAELRITGQEERADALLALGRTAEAVADLRALTLEHPLRERPWRAMMLALHSCGRQAEALSTFRRYDELLAEQGLRPSAAVRHLRTAILATPEALRPRRTNRPAPDRPAPATPLTVPAQLPAASAAFAGRTGYLRRLDALLAKAEGGGPATVVLTAVTGSAGIGKTSLAVHWAHTVRPHFPDGQLFVDLRGYSAGQPLRPLDALAGFLRALGVPADQIPVEPDQAAAMYRSLLAGRRMLVLLDNAHSAEQVRPLLPGDPGCLTLVTSRDRLTGLTARDGAHRLAVDVLTRLEARHLLERVLGEARVRAEPEAADDLAELCACLPLALRIAAANLIDHPGRWIAERVSELAAGDRLAILAVDGDPHTAVRAAFALSYTELDPLTRRLFRLLGLVPGHDVTAEAAAALVGLTPPEAAKVLDRLAARHLIGQPTPGRYAFHDLLRCYARDRAEQEDLAADRRTALDRLFDWYLRRADAAARVLGPEKLRLALPPAPPGAESAAGFADHAEALAWLDAERRNLCAVVHHAAEHGPRPVAWLLSDALRGYFWHRQYLVDWLAVAEAARAAGRVFGNLPAQAAAEQSLGDAAQRHSRYTKAVQHYDRALELAREAEWPQGQAAALGSLGIVHRQIGQVAAAADHTTAALVLNRRVGWLAGEASNLIILGRLYLELDRLPAAERHVTDGLRLFRQLESCYGEALSLEILGEICHAQGRHDAAVDHLSRALTLSQEIGNLGTAASAMRLLAVVHRDLGRLAEATDLATAAAAMAREIKDSRGEADAQAALASIHQLLRGDEPVEARPERAMAVPGDRRGS